MIAEYDYGPLFTPLTERGTVMLPGLVGGASWAGAAARPNAGMLYVPSVTLPWVVSVAPEPDGSDYQYALGSRTPGPFGEGLLSFLKPPYGRVTAIDLNTGDHLWVQTMGQGPTDHPLLRDLDLPSMGWPFRTHLLATDSVLFAAQDGLAAITGGTPRGNALRFELTDVDPALLVLDIADGRIARRIPLPANARGALAGYRLNGQVYVVVPTGGTNLPAELVALRTVAAGN